MQLKRLSIDADLSESVLEQATSECPSSTGHCLYVSTYNIDTGVILSRLYKMTLCVDDHLPKDSWYLKSQYFGVFSPGA